MKKFLQILGILYTILISYNLNALEPELVSQFKPVTGSGFFGDGTNPREIEIFPFDNVNDGRFNDTGTYDDWSFWLTGQNETGYFIIDLLDIYDISKFEIQNTHNRDYNDRGTKDFRISLSVDGLNYETVIDDTLATVFGTGNIIPWIDFTIPNTSARFVKFDVDSYYLDSGGLNELNVYGIPAVHGQNYALDFSTCEEWKFVEVGKDSRFDTDEITVEAWIKPTCIPTGHYIYEGRSTIVWNGDHHSGHDPYIFYINEYGSLEAHVGFLNNPGLFIIDDTPVSLNRWHHVALVITSSKIELYLDGFKTEGIIHDRGVPDKGYSFVSIGRHRFYKNPFGGLIDEVRIWDIALTEQEIQQLMYAELVGNEPGIVALWKFNEGTGQFVGDSSLNAIDGFLGNTAEIDIYDPTWVISDRPSEPTPPQIVSIDIKPGSYPNCLNMNGSGLIPVAILGSDTFVVTQIDISTLKFAGLDVRVKGNSNPQCSIADVSGDFTDLSGTPDGYDDLVCHFLDDPTVWTPDNGTATLTGELYDGTPIEGTDSICIVQ